MGVTYIAHRLFALHDRMLAAELAAGIAESVGKSSQTFLPYCDTNEDTIVAELKGKYLFEQDCKRLNSLDLFLGILHGPSYDDGVCMEMGFAFALGKPIVVMISDFITYTWGYHGEPSIFADPLLDLMVTEVIHVTNPALPDTTSSKDQYGSARYKSFWQQNRVALGCALSSTIQAASNLLCEPKSSTQIPDYEGENLIYVELLPSMIFNLPDWVNDISTTASKFGWNIYISQRHQRSNSRSETLSRARQDLTMASKSKILVLDGNGAEVSSGSALLVGYALAKRRETLLLYSGAQITHAYGREGNARNLMLLYGSKRILQSPIDIHQALTNILCTLY